MNTEENAPTALPIGYTQTMIDELQEALNAIAGSKSTAARERNVMTAHVLNARAARRYLSGIIAQGSHWMAMDAEVVDATFREYERVIMDVANMNYRALRK